MEEQHEMGCISEYVEREAMNMWRREVERKGKEVMFGKG